MTIENRDDYIAYRFERAKESLEEALILAENKKWNTVVNRLYYACFYAVIALLIKNNCETQTHDGVRTIFGFHFVKTGKVEKEAGRFFSKLFDYRQKGDYGDLFDYDMDIVLPLIDQTKLFIDTIEVLLDDSNL
jgi:uncharacterized protein (UPF0332 family)